MYAKNASLLVTPCAAQRARNFRLGPGRVQSTSQPTTLPLQPPTHPSLTLLVSMCNAMLSIIKFASNGLNA
jgi:hypothetical protein